MRFILFAAVLFLLPNACQYPVGSSELPDLKQFLVIDAKLTENYGKVLVTYTLTDVTPGGGYLNPPPINASAYVEDSQGNQTYFAVDGSINTAFQGVVGETYKLFVFANGEAYESKPETMPACPSLDSLSVVFTREDSRAPNDFSYYGFDVYAQASDIPNQNNYYQWDWIHYEKAVGCAVVQEGGRDVLYPCDPGDCWNIAYNTRIVVQSDQLRDGQPLANKVVRIPFTTPPNKYYLKVEQRSITPTVFSYLQSQETQTQNVGSIFDIPAQTRFSPNVYNVNNPDEKILGVFSVFSYRTKVVYIDRSQEINGVRARVSIFRPPFTSDPFAAAPCVESLYRTQNRPEGWEE
ncbi:MAG: DUF4249 domain-containing protein [Saprospiraceae bacterium]|nr:DUF4249 domain-containing protein [Saprospiraceae bacterium]